MQPITINITINITPDGVAFVEEMGEVEATEDEADKLPGGVGYFITDGDENYVEEGPYVTRIK